MSNILVTGGHGYIGSHVVYAFLDAGYGVAVIDNHSAGVWVDFPPAVRCYEGDVGDTSFIDRVLTAVKPQAVLHFAGSIIVPESVAYPEKYYENNVFASLSLIKACLRHGVRRFVFSSSAAVYGIPEDGVATERSATRPINPYGRSKLMVEQILSDIAKAHPFCYAALRYFNVAGADMHGRTGQSTPQATHLIKIATEAAVGVRAHVEIFGTDYATPDGTCIRDYIHVSDLAAAHLAVFEHILETNESRVFNCGNGEGFSVREVMAVVERVSGAAIKTIDAPRRAGDPPCLIADPALIKAQTGWRAQWTNLDDIVAHALAWERRNLVNA